tara:strand:+ start:910 stop:1899 length:990 start_codon:yes stop_codon:yes gene_type:complete
MTVHYNSITIFGPTASGKTTFSIEVAKELNRLGKKAEIINFDSLLFYKELNIGTAKPSIEEMSNIPHHLINICSYKEPLNSSDFVELAIPVINKLISNNATPIFVGGSGFYLRALLKGMYESSEKEFNEKSEKKFKKIISENDNKNNEVLLKYLESHDTESLTNIHKNDYYRLSRAVEYHLKNNKKLSSQKKKLDLNYPYDFSKNIKHRLKPLNIYLEIPKEEHLKIIDNRTKTMISSGLIDEVINILNLDTETNFKPLRSIGYKETIDFIVNKLSSKVDLIERINISTRQLAKAQRTFFKKVTPKETINPTIDLNKKVRDVLSLFKER